MFIDNFRSSSPTRQAALIGFVTLIGAALIFSAWYFFLRTPYVEAFNNLKSSDAVTIVAELDRLKTPYKLTNEGTSIAVPEDKVDSARINVLGGDLPLKGAVGFELFNKTDMGLTEFAQKINYQRALQGELARTIMALEEVDSARVHLSLPESGIFEQDKRVAKASVTITTKFGGSINPAVVRGLQRLVASAVPDLDASNVVILDARGQLISEDPASVSKISEQAMGPLEQSYADKIYEAIKVARIAIPMRVDVIQIGGTANKEKEEVPSSGESMQSKSDPFNPEQREIPLKVTIFLATEPSASMEERLLILAKQAMVFQETRGDLIFVQLDPSLAPVALPPINTVLPHRKVEALQKREFGSLQFQLWPIIFMVGLLLLLFFLSRILQPRKSLSIEERKAFANKLKTLLDDEAPNVQPTR
jgi:flagellar M-ring protein FliF